MSNRGATSQGELGTEGTASAPISPTNVLYIKLGSHGDWEHDCIDVQQTIKIGYNPANHEDCLRKDWDRVEQQMFDFRRKEDPSRTSPTARKIARSDVRQIKDFYTEGENTLWITFRNRKLYWCFAEARVQRDRENNKIRKTRGSWSSDSIQGIVLSEEHLSGHVVRLKAYRDTICGASGRARTHIINRINGTLSPDFEAAKIAEKEYVLRIAKLIQDLDPKDFEVLIDLIFRQSGWKRTSPLGDQEKTIDLVLQVSITNDTIAAQVKSTASLADYHAYLERLKESDYSRCYFIVHTPDVSLANAGKSRLDPRLELIGPYELASWVIEHGLSKWVMDKAL